MRTFHIEIHMESVTGTKGMRPCTLPRPARTLQGHFGTSALCDSDLT